MSSQEDEATKKEELADDQHNHESIQDQVSEHVQDDKSDGNDSNTPQSESAQLLEELAIKKRYGGLLPKIKPPLISKDHEHAFFDSADWALGKQAGQKPKGPLELALRPKLQPTPQHQTRSRRSTYASLSDNSEDEANTTTDHDHQNVHDHDSIDIDIDEANVGEESKCCHEASDHTGAAAESFSASKQTN